MKILITLLLLMLNAHAQEQKYVDMSNMRQFNFGKCNGIDGNYIPNLSRNFYTAETCQDAYLEYDVCSIEASVFEKAFESSASIENGKIVKKDIFFKEYKGQCDSWLKVRTRGCKKFIKREATRCGGRSKYTKNNFFNPRAKTHTGLIKTKDILSFSESEYKIEQDRIAAKQERQRLAKLEQDRIAAKQERQRLAKLEQEKAYRLKQQRQKEDYQTVCAEEIADATDEVRSIEILMNIGSRSEQICNLIKTYAIQRDSIQTCIDNRQNNLRQSDINILNRQIDEFKRVIDENTEVGRQLSSSFYCASAYTGGGSSGATGWGGILLQGLDLYKTYLENKK